MRNFVIPFLLVFLLITLASAKPMEMTSAQIYMGNKDYNKAIEYYNQAIDLLKKDVAEIEAKGKRDKGSLKNLSTCYFEVGQCYQLIGDYKLMSENFDQSLLIEDKYYDKISDIRDELYRRFFNEGVEPFNNGDFQTSSEKFSLVIIIDPENMPAYKQRGLCYLQMSKYEEALADFKRVIELEGVLEVKEKDVDLRKNIANIYYKLERLDEAMIGYEEALVLDPKDTHIISRLAMMYQEKGNSKEAIEMYDRALAESPEKTDLWFNRGILFFNMENYEEAVKSFNKVIELNPQDAESLMNLVNSLWMAGLFGQAIPYLEKAVAIEPDNVQAWQFLSVACIKESAREDIDDSTKAALIKRGTEAIKKYKELKGE